MYHPDKIIVLDGSLMRSPPQCHSDRGGLELRPAEHEPDTQTATPRRKVGVKASRENKVTNLTNGDKLHKQSIYKGENNGTYARTQTLMGNQPNATRVTNSKYL